MATDSIYRKTELRDATDDVKRVPNFLYIGTSKAGSTWIFNLLKHHPDVYVAHSKGLYFFDSHYDHGVDWYLKHFEEAPSESLTKCEISHSYLYSKAAVGRIAEMNPDMKLMVCLREPVDRAFSAYLHGVRNGIYPAGTTFEQALNSVDPSLIERGRYATHLAPYLAEFGRQHLHVSVFDELGSDPKGFALDILRFLEVPEMEVGENLKKKVMPAGTPRFRPLVRLAKGASAYARKIGLKKLRGRMKTSRLARNLLYKPLEKKDKPTINEETKARLQEIFRPEMQQLDELLKADFVSRWGY